MRLSACGEAQGIRPACNRGTGQKNSKPGRLLCEHSLGKEVRLSVSSDEKCPICAVIPSSHTRSIKEMW